MESACAVIVMENAPDQAAEAASPVASAIGRIADDRTKWRIVVEAWQGDTGYEGRIVFHADEPVVLPPLIGPVMLHGETREDVLRAAYDMSDERMRALLRSLS